MKKITLEIDVHEHNTTVHLGNGEWLKFKNKTKAEKFIRKYKQVLGDNISLLNVLQPQINLIYRQNILQLDDSTQRSVQYYLKSYDERFDFIYRNYSEGNQNAFVFSNIENCFEHLNSSASLLYSFGKLHKNYTLKNAVKPILKNLKILFSTYQADKRSLNVDNSYMNIKEVKPLKLKVS